MTDAFAGKGERVPRARCAPAMTHPENLPCHSEPVRTPARESVIPLCKGPGGRIATTSDIGHWFRNDRRFYKGCGATPGGGLGAARPTAWLVGADDPVRPGPTTQHLVGQGPCALPRGCCKANSHPCSQIISTPISAGETPDMRLAWPRFSGRTALSFSRASRRRPWIAV